MNLPIIGICDGYITFFESGDRAENYIEPIDVENNEWELYDATGRRLSLTIGSLTRDRAVISELEPPEYNEERLLVSIVGNLLNLSDRTKRKLGIPSDERVLKEMTLSELVMLAQHAFQV